MRGVELLQYLVHDGVGEVGNHGELHLPGPETEGEDGASTYRLFNWWAELSETWTLRLNWASR